MTASAERVRSDRRSLTIGQTFLVAAAAVAIIVAVGFFEFLRHSRAAILEASERLRESAARRVGGEVAASLGDAERALVDVERLVLSGAVVASDTTALEVALFAELTSARRLAEVTFTGALFQGYDASGEARVDPDGRFQLSVFRARDGQIMTRVVRRDGGAFVSSYRGHGADGGFATSPFVASGPAMDPTMHPTFSVIAAERNQGRALWSDLHYSELDAGSRDPRVVLSVQKAVLGGRGRLLGVIRVALLTGDLDAIARTRVDASVAVDPHRVLLLAVSSGGEHEARLVARVGPNDRLRVFGDELRVVPDNPPPEIAALLTSPLVRGLVPDHPNAQGILTVAGNRYLATLRELSSTSGGTAGWLVAVVVPEAYYTADLVRFEHTFLLVFMGTLALVLAIGGATLNGIRRGLGEVVATTSSMRRFDFAPRAHRSRLREIDEVMLGLERAKTVARAMGKYIPLDLVRRLYEHNQEPALGGELAELALLFTDIEGFTTLSERLPPDELSRRLGDYLEAMTTAIGRTSGTIDKYIGDAVMAFWNAPAPVEGYAVRACEAVLECKRATAELYASPVWQGLPQLVTRYGLHQAKVMVGHFGAQSRLSYTALGDGVNLAARLEPLCKQYGVTVLVSETIFAAAKDRFLFRRIDRVAVKGKTHGIDVYELLGASGDDLPEREIALEYERAFDAYLELDFAAAAAIVDRQPSDPPSAVLAARCREYVRNPPPLGWNRVHVARSK